MAAENIKLEAYRIPHQWNRKHILIQGAFISSCGTDHFPNIPISKPKSALSKNRSAPFSKKKNTLVIFMALTA
jgi:hypothetical protein